jgi:hypothetical protein
MHPFFVAGKNFVLAAPLVLIVAAVSFLAGIIYTFLLPLWWELFLNKGIFIPDGQSEVYWNWKLAWPVTQIPIFLCSLAGFWLQAPSADSWTSRLLKRQALAAIAGLVLGATLVVPYFLDLDKSMTVNSFLVSVYDGLILPPTLFNLVILALFNQKAPRPRLSEDEGRILSYHGLLFCLIAILPISFAQPMPRQNSIAASAAITAAVLSWKSKARSKLSLAIGALAITIIAFEVFKSKPLACVFGF